MLPRDQKRTALSRPLVISAVLALAFCTTAQATAAESWADQRLKLVDGLFVWLDASAENKARAAAGQLMLDDGELLDVWHDASGLHHDVAQTSGPSLPRLRIDGSEAFACFDGAHTFLDRAGLAAAYDAITVFIVAAPHANDGAFAALLATNAAGVNDYTSGITIDQGPVATEGFDVLNIEGSGFGGARNLKTDRGPLLHVTRLCVTCSAGAEGTALFVDGRAQGKRDRTAGKIAIDRLTVGARFYGNGETPHTQGFFAGEIAEVLVYDRALSTAERDKVDQYLAAKYGPARVVPAPPRLSGSKPLVRVKDPPPVQVFVPGFAVRELPLDLTNINNVLYRRDGVLVALAYNGDIHLLSDTDGDGLEDRAQLFWENRGRIRAPIGMDLTPENYPRGRGVFLASKANCLLVVDTTGDDRADEEITVADGWKETPHGVDALGVVCDPRDGSVYFGLGCQDFTNAYVVSPEGQAQYDIASERGTILHVAPDFRSRKIVATGIRFPVALRFNQQRDLFCTDQEGATWLANGNPFDELLHIEPGRHYGFPPRHPRHLPQPIDEPSVFDYAPQHQSACGLNFNEPVAGGPVFGPAWWQSDAIVTGYSRGKLYRTKLVKTPAGYIAQNQLLASLSMLPADACVSPTGGLVVAAHSGGPDWGSGPSGKGKLFKIVTAAPDAPRPALVWPQTPREVWIAFDRELDPKSLPDASTAAIEFGSFVAAGDRFESLRPGYATVVQQVRGERNELAVLGVSVTADRRHLIIATAPHATASHYALTLPRAESPGTHGDNHGALPQANQTDLEYDLTGVEVVSESAGGERWQGWLPHLDLAVARALTRASRRHEQLWEGLARSGTLLLRMQLDLRDMLRPAVQPGAKLDYSWPEEIVTLVVSSSAPVEATFAGREIRSVSVDGRQVIEIEAPTSASDSLHPLALRVLRTGQDPQPTLTISWHTKEDARPRALPLRRMLLPWAKLGVEANEIHDNAELAELRDGNWSRGHKVFLSEEAACAKCHQVRGEGGMIGPDLSNLVQRDYASVLRDIVEPSFSINPDFIAHTVVLEDGRVFTGTARTQGDDLIIGGQDGRETTVARSEIEQLNPAATSIMPQDLHKRLGPEKLRDLLTFLLVAGPHMPDYGKGTPPPLHSTGEVSAILAGAAVVDATPPRPLNIVLVTGPKDHGPGEHDYPAWQKVWQRLLGLADQTRVSIADQWPTPEQLKSADVLVFYQQGKWTPQRAADIDAVLARGAGLVYIHYAVDGGDDAPGFAQRIGLAWRGGESRFRHGPLDVSLRPGRDHPIARNFDLLHLHDESYWNLTGDPAAVRLLGSGVEEGREQPLFWTLAPGRGRVFVSIPGHFSWTFDDPLFRVLLLRGMAWAAGESVDRFNELVTPGARIQAPPSRQPRVPATAQ